MGPRNASVFFTVEEDAFKSRDGKISDIRVWPTLRDLTLSAYSIQNTAMKAQSSKQITVSIRV
jgi:hypothetical protein